MLYVYAISQDIITIDDAREGLRRGFTTEYDFRKGVEDEMITGSQYEQVVQKPYIATVGEA